VGITATIEADGNVSGGRYFGDGATFEIVPSEPTTETATFAVGLGEPYTYDPGLGITIDVLPAGSSPTYEESTGVLGLTPGNYLIKARFGDGPSTTRFFVVDGTGPSLSYSRDTSIWTLPTDSGLVVSATDSGAGVRSLEVNVVDENGTTLQEATGVDPDGDSVFTARLDPTVVDLGAVARPTVTVEAVDEVGNVTTESFQLFVDHAKPLVTVSPKSSLWSDAAVEFTVTASDAESGLASVCLTRNDGTCELITLVDGVYTDTIDTEGLTSLEATATDNVGNTNTDSTDIRVDTTAPTVSITPNDTTWRRGEVSVTIDVSDPGGDAASGIASVCITTTGPDCVELLPDAEGNYRTTLTVPADTDGTPIISATATDNADNTTTDGPVTFYIDNKAPVVTLGGTLEGDRQRG
jgi:hypothetical protein